MGQVDQRGREYLSRIFSLVEARMAEVTSKLSSLPSNIAPVVCLSAALVAWFVWRGGRGRRSRSDNGRADRRGCKNSLPYLWNGAWKAALREGKARGGLS